VAAKVDLDPRGEPAEVKRFITPDHERRFGEIHFRGDLLHSALVRRALQQAHGSRIAGERFFGERVDDENRQAHGVFLSIKSPVPWERPASLASAGPHRAPPDP
jgi:hypothetical protein